MIDPVHPAAPADDELSALATATAALGDRLAVAAPASGPGGDDAVGRVGPAQRVADQESRHSSDLVAGTETAEMVAHRGEPRRRTALDLFVESCRQGRCVAADGLAQVDECATEQVEGDLQRDRLLAGQMFRAYRDWVSDHPARSSSRDGCEIVSLAEAAKGDKGAQAAAILGPERDYVHPPLTVTHFAAGGVRTRDIVGPTPIPSRAILGPERDYDHPRRDVIVERMARDILAARRDGRHSSVLDLTEFGWTQAQAMRWGAMAHELAGRVDVVCQDVVERLAAREATAARARGAEIDRQMEAAVAAALAPAPKTGDMAQMLDDIGEAS